MLKQLEKEAEEDEEIYDKMAPLPIKHKDKRKPALPNMANIKETKPAKINNIKVIWRPLPPAPCCPLLSRYTVVSTSCDLPWYDIAVYCTRLGTGSWPFSSSSWEESRILVYRI